MTTDHTAALQRFFATFEQASVDEDWDRYGSLFLERFLNLDPASATTVDRDQLIAFLPHRRAFFANAGATGTRLVRLEVASLDELHALATTTWSVVFADPCHRPVELETTFLLRNEDGWRIAVYLNHAAVLDLLADAAQP